jgi:hypothetical protein
MAADINREAGEGPVLTSTRGGEEVGGGASSGNKRAAYMGSVLQYGPAGGASAIGGIQTGSADKGAEDELL